MKTIDNDTVFTLGLSVAFLIKNKIDTCITLKTATKSLYHFTSAERTTEEGTSTGAKRAV